MKKSLQKIKNYWNVFRYQNWLTHGGGFETLSLKKRYHGYFKEVDDDIRMAKTYFESTIKEGEELTPINYAILKRLNHCISITSKYSSEVSADKDIEAILSRK